ncbi:ATP-binding cassette domain-containing protein [Paenibacillus sp. 1011MAR3C5]|uniref:ABC transporter ATP-binding protein n=1 Tax=Paenibacillus sp. 1011MAR3C5 TaxID=1675787 RepID=UPI000E6B6292|nr:ATP-binding cassette domain-containing protein [Paenibacillus sp. 1011MAR3C5]RJE89662.1 ATP-binding cassette domain-containing protein [Paenibacillus sp. 1011MAR3C5]
MIEVEEISKVYTQFKRSSGVLGAIKNLVSREHTLINAVNQISFTIKRGEAVGYLGPNGAGKSTMIKMLTGILVPTSGKVTVNGLVPHKHRHEIAKKIGIVFGQRSQLWWDLPVEDSFELHKRIYKLNDAEYRKNMNVFLELLSLKDFINQPVRQLSLGQRMRAEIGLALLHNPEIVFLDEPTIGLDVTAKDNIRAFIKQMNLDRKVSILLTSHDLKDIEEICPRMLIVNKGELIFDGTVDHLKSNLSMEKIITIEFVIDPGHDFEIENAVIMDDYGIRKTFKINKGLNSAIDFIQSVSKRYPIKDFTLQDSDIEDIIRVYYRSLEDVSANGSNQQKQMSVV